MSEQQLIDIETKLSHQEFLIEKLNQVIYQHERTISLLEVKIATIVKLLPETAGLDRAIGPANEKPPHY